jgi:heat shock protein HslJ
MPEMEIRLKQMQVSGTSGCNTYSTKISKLATNAIKFCTIVSTKRRVLAKILSKNILRPWHSGDLSNKRKIQHSIMKRGENSILHEKSSKLVEYKLHDIWTVIRIAGNPINRMSPIPRMELNLTTMRVLGNSCNDYTEIKEVSDTLIVFGNIATTKKCQNGCRCKFRRCNIKVTAYKLEGLNLIFFNNNGKKSCFFLKAD